MWSVWNREMEKIEGEIAMHTNQLPLNGMTVLWIFHILVTFSSCVGGDHFSILPPYVKKMSGIKAYVVDIALEMSFRDEIFIML